MSNNCGDGRVAAAVACTCAPEWINDERERERSTVSSKEVKSNDLLLIDLEEVRAKTVAEQGSREVLTPTLPSGEFCFRASARLARLCHRLALEMAATERGYIVPAVTQSRMSRLV